MSIVDWVIVVANIVIAGATATYAYLTNKLARISHDQLEQMKKQITSAYRPRLTVDHVENHGYFQVSNIGNSKAINIDIKYHFEFDSVANGSGKVILYSKYINEGDSSSIIEPIVISKSEMERISEYCINTFGSDDQAEGNKPFKLDNYKIVLNIEYNNINSDNFNDIQILFTFVKFDTSRQKYQVIGYW